jgi:hypothetical protein
MKLFRTETTKDEIKNISIGDILTNMYIPITGEIFTYSALKTSDIAYDTNSNKLRAEGEFAWGMFLIAKYAVPLTVLSYYLR